MERVLQQETAFDEQTQSGSGEFELVLGRRQLVIWLFLATVIVAVASSGAYFAAKSALARSQPFAAAAAPAPVSPPAAAPSKPVQATINTAAGLPVEQPPEVGAVYLQLGALERGFARVLVEGLRSMGFAAIVAPGPSERVFRVLVGPAKDPASLKRMKDALEETGLSPFIRRYEAPTQTAQATPNTP